MRHILFLGAAAMLLAAPHVRGNGAPPFKQFPPQPQFQAPNFKINIEVDEKATEPRLLVPIQAMFGGGVGLGGGFGVGGGAIGAAGNFGVQGGPPANFGNLGNFGLQGGPPPGVFGQPGGTPPAPPKPRPGGGKDEDPA